jgi:hypothetical protein
VDRSVVTIWKLADTARPWATLNATDLGISWVAWSGDGKTLASGDGDRAVQLWDTSNWSKLRGFKAHTNVVIQGVFSPDSRTLATASWDGTAKLWQVATGQQLLTLHCAGPCWSIAFSQDGRTLATAGDTGGTGEVGVRLWRAADEISADAPVDNRRPAAEIAHVATSPTIGQPESEPQGPLDRTVLRLKDKCRQSVAGAVQAIREADQISVDVEASPSSLLFLGELRILGGKPDEAAAFIRKSISAGGNRVWHFKSLGWALCAAGNEKDARREFSAALGTTAIESADLDRLAAAYFLDRIDSSTFIRLAGAKGAAGPSFAQFYIGQRHWWRGERGAARAHFQQAVDAAKNSNATGMFINWAGACLRNSKDEQAPDK